MSKRNLVIFSPLPPARNGIADYTATFLHDLGDEFNLYLVIDDAQPPPTVDVGTLVRLPEYLRHERSFSTIGHAYQVGNNSGHAYLLPIMERHPGLTTVHDLSLHGLMDHAFVEHKQGRSHQELMFEAYGRRGLEVAQQIALQGGKSEVCYLEFGFLPVIAYRSMGLVTHSQLGRLRLAAASRGTPVFVVPHAYHPKAAEFFGPRPQVRKDSRAKLKLPEQSLLLLCAGFVTRAKQLDRVLGALRILREAGHHCVLIIAGEVRPSDYDLWGRIKSYGMENSVLVRDYVDNDEFFAYIAAVDILVNLRYPTLGETSGTLTNALAIGSCAVVTELGTFAELPEACAVRVPVTAMTDHGLAERLVPLIVDAKLRMYHEMESLRFARREFAPEVSVARYVSALEETVFARVHAGRSGLERFELMAKQLRHEVEHTVSELLSGCIKGKAQLWWREMLLPLGLHDMTLLICDEEDFSAALARRAFRWKNESIIPTVPNALCDIDICDASVALVVLSDRDIATLGVFILGAANRVLCLRGILVLDIVFDDEAPLITSFGSASPDHQKGAFNVSDKKLLAEILEANGFRIDQWADRFTETVDEGVAQTSRNREMAVRATKISHSVISYPEAVFSNYAPF
ncbi:MAG: glycosyltransferase [Alphaproteobacteria bacterium]